MQELKADDFKYQPNKILFEICRDLFLVEKPVDIVTVSQSCQNVDYIVEVANSTPTTANLKYYIDVVKDTAKRFTAWQKAQEFITALETEELSDCQNIVSKLSDSLIDNNSSEVLDIKQAISNFYSTKGNKREYIATGFETLDKHVFIETGDFIVLGGRPSAGKTALTLQIALNMAKKRRVAYFSLETKPDKIFDRVFANLVEMNLRDIKTGGSSIESRDWNKFSANIQNMHTLDFQVVKGAGMTVTQIKAKAMELKADVIFVDYLGLIKSAGKDRYEKVTNVSMDLHTFAQQSNLPIIALSQLKRKDDKTPTMDDLRESGQIEQDADAVIFIHQPSKDNQERELVIGKNKEGEQGHIKLSFKGQFQKFWEVVDR